MSEPRNIRDYVDRHLERLQANLAEALSSGQVEAVHQLRVASRRLEEPLELCRPWVKSRTLDRTTKTLKRSRSAFRRVRELDVLRLSLDAPGVEPIEPEGSELLVRELAADRARQLLKAGNKSVKLGLRGMEQAVHGMLQEFGRSGGCSPQWISARLHGLVVQRAERVLRVDPAEGRADLHQTRLALKRLRYALELHGSLLGGKQSLIKRFKGMQDRLGDWNDALQAARYLSGLARRRQVVINEPGAAEALLSHAGRRAGQSRKIAEVFRNEWPAFRAIIERLAAGGFEASDDTDGGRRRGASEQEVSHGHEQRH